MSEDTSLPAGEPASTRPSTPAEGAASPGPLWARLREWVWRERELARALAQPGEPRRRRWLASAERSLAAGDETLAAWPLGRAGEGDPVMDEEAVHEDHVALDLQWLASDPTIYSEALHVFDTAELEATAPANSWTVTLNNAGTSAATAARHGLRVVITPATRCVGPRVMVPLRGEVVTWPGLVIEVGQVFRWEADGTSWIGGQQVSGRRTPFTAPLVLRPGDQDLNIDCTSGTFDVRTEHRDTFA